MSIVALLAGLLQEPWFGGSPETGGEYGPSDGPGAFLYEDGAVHDFAFTLAPDQMDLLERDGPDVRATLTYEGVNWEVGFKLKGSSTYQDLDGKPSIKVDLEQWVEDQRMVGVRRLTLNSMIFDPTMLREHVAYALYEAMGVPAPRHGYARVTINGEPYGLYGIVETMDEQWLRRTFPGDSDGNLYDSKYTNADLTSVGIGAYELKEGKPVEPYADLRELVSEIDGSNILDVLDRRFDREGVLGMWAVDLVTANWDGYTRNTNNYLLYHATVSDRWHFVPWGQDTAFRGGGFLYMGLKGRLVNACVNDGDCRSALEAKVVEALDVWEALDLVGYAQAAWAAIGEHCEADPKRNMDCDPEDIYDALTDRPEQIRRELGL
ncbi:MAG: CotH kinase family protein [Myxococcota bacterium]